MGHGRERETIGRLDARTEHEPKIKLSEARELELKKEADLREADVLAKQLEAVNAELRAVEETDGAVDIDWLCGKIARMRVFTDEAGLMNKSLADVGGGVLLISQFTLHASTKKGNRPSFTRAAKPEVAIPLYEQFIARIQ